MMEEEDLLSMKEQWILGRSMQHNCYRLGREVCQMSIVAKETWGANEGRSTN